MDLGGSAFVEDRRLEAGSLTILSSTKSSFYSVSDREQGAASFCHLVADLLVGRDKAARPCGRVFDERTGERDAAFIGIADGVGNTGIRNSAT